MTLYPQRNTAVARGFDRRDGVFALKRVQRFRIMFVMSCMAIMNTCLAIDVPLQIAAMYDLRDERNDRLHGNHPSSPIYGITHVEGDLVHVMQCDSGIFPPDTDGTASAQTPLRFITRIGYGMAPIFEQPGKFADGVFPRPTGSLFIRVFNAPTLAEATFYVDSHVHTMGNDDAIFRIESRRTSQPIDPRDDDDDGLNNSWEISYGTDTGDQDSDDDGIMDGLEHMAGLNPLDKDSNLAMAQVRCHGASLCVEWTSVSGRTYQVEAMSPTSAGDYIPVGSDVVATSYLARVDLSIDFNEALTCYRVIRLD